MTTRYINYAAVRAFVRVWVPIGEARMAGTYVYDGLHDADLLAVAAHVGARFGLDGVALLDQVYHAANIEWDFYMCSRMPVAAPASRRLQDALVDECARPRIVVQIAPPIFYTTGEAAKVCGVCRNTILEYERQGVVHPQRLGGNRQRMFTHTELAAIKKRRAGRPA